MNNPCLHIAITHGFDWFKACTTKESKLLPTIFAPEFLEVGNILDKDPTVLFSVTPTAHFTKVQLHLKHNIPECSVRGVTKRQCSVSICANEGLTKCRTSHHKVSDLYQQFRNNTTLKIISAATLIVYKASLFLDQHNQMTLTRATRQKGVDLPINL